MAPPPHAGRASGLLYALAAYLSWGLLPLYFRALAQVPPLEILAHRIVWSLALLAALTWLLRRGPEALRPLRSRRGFATLCATTSLITVNWLVYIWAVHSHRVLEASLGYFINPLVSVLLGVLFLREPLTRRQKAAVGLAAAGVAVLVARAAAFPWVALVLAASFGTYGLLRKRERIDAVGGLLVETALLAPAAAWWLWRLQAAGQGHFGTAPRLTWLLAAAGVVTAVPLIWFAQGVLRLRLSTVGLLQYVAPTMQFSIAVFLFHETFTAAHGLAFACIWTALALYSAEALAAVRRNEAVG
jgi:chloramphenicol-sensitive protein RarD